MVACVFPARAKGLGEMTSTKKIKRRRLARTVCASASAAALLFGAGPALADPPPTGPLGNFLNIHSNLCVGVSGGYAVLENCYADTQDELWNLRSTFTDILGVTWYQYVNGNGQCLGIAGASTAEDARVVARDHECGTISTNPDQFWSNPDSVDGGDMYNFDTQWVLGVQGASTAPGAAILEASTYCSNGGDCHPDQIWLF